jgi:hypothetical protein
MAIKTCQIVGPTLYPSKSLTTNRRAADPGGATPKAEQTRQTRCPVQPAAPLPRPAHSLPSTAGRPSPIPRAPSRRRRRCRPGNSAQRSARSGLDHVLRTGRSSARAGQPALARIIRRGIGDGGVRARGTVAPGARRSRFAGCEDGVRLGHAAHVVRAAADGGGWPASSGRRGTDSRRAG